MDAIESLNGSTTLNTQPTGVICINHSGTAALLVKVDGSIEMEAKEGQNINLNTSDKEKDIISYLDFIHWDKYVEEAVISHYIRSVLVTTVNQDSGSLQVHTNGVVEPSTTRPDYSACAFMIKAKSADKVPLNTLCSTCSD